MKQNEVMFFNYDNMGLGGLWQNISWLLTNQEYETELEINLHLNDYNFNRFVEIYQCFDLPKGPVHIIGRPTIHLDEDPQKTWKENLKDLKIPNYTEEQIQTVPCTLRHEYYPSAFNNNETNDFICFYFQGPAQEYNGHEYTMNRNINDIDCEIIYKNLKEWNNPIELGSHMSIRENVMYLATCKYAVGREGGWTHVAHSTRTDYIPVMYNRHPALDYAHGKENKYLKEFMSVNECRNKKFR